MMNEGLNKSLSVFDNAPAWSQEIALARAEFLDSAKKYIDQQKGEISKGQALKKFLRGFNQGFFGEDVREKLRNGSISKDTYYRWKRAYKRDGISGLLEKFNNGGCKIAPEIKQEIEKLIWQDHLCRYQDVCDDLGIIFQKTKLPHYTTIRSHVRQYKKSHWAELVLKHEGAKGLRDRNMEVALGRADGDLTWPNELWELDATLADLFTERKIEEVFIRTLDGKRCKVIGCIDVFSRSVRFYLTEKETALQVGQVIRDRIIAWGIPEEVVIDNGRSFKNKRILPFLRDLGISVRICTPGEPIEKPHIERAFRTLTEGLFRRLPGYSGNSVANRPNEIEIKYGMEELQEIIDRWVINRYSEMIHRGTGQRPRERMSPLGFKPKFIENERQLDLLLMKEYSRKVRQGFIEFEGGRFFHPKLPETQTVKFRVNDFDASELIVFHDGQFLCLAEDYRRKGKTPEEIREAKKERNRELRTRIKAHEALIDKKKPKDANILALIDHGQKTKPIELPKKGDVIEFPGLKGIQFSKPGLDQNESLSNVREIHEVHDPRLKHTRQDHYVDLMSRKYAGEVLDASDTEWLDNFLQSDEYRMIAPYLEEQVQGRIANEG